MIEKLKSLFGPTVIEEEAPSPALAGAALMFEVAWADHDVADAEVEQISALLKSLFGLNPESIEALIAKTRELHDESVGVYPFTRAINQELDQEQKFQIVCALWQIALTDNTLDRFEEHAIRRIAELLYVPHSKFIEAKQIARAATQ